MCNAERGEGTRHKGRWIVQSYHRPTGTPWSDEECPHYQTLEEVKEAIREDIGAQQMGLVDEVEFMCNRCGAGVPMVRVGTHSEGGCPDCGKVFRLGSGVPANA